MSDPKRAGLPVVLVSLFALTAAVPQEVAQSPIEGLSMENIKSTSGQDLLEYIVVRNFLFDIDYLSDPESIARYLQDYEIAYPSPAATILTREAAVVRELFTISDEDVLAAVPDFESPEIWKAASRAAPRQAMVRRALATGESFGRVLAAVMTLGYDLEAWRRLVFETVSPGTTLHHDDVPEAEMLVRALQRAFELGIERGLDAELEEGAK